MADENTPLDQHEGVRPGETLAEYVNRMIKESQTGAEGEAPAGPQVPKIDHAPQNKDEAAELGKMFAEYRAEVAALRSELAAHRPRTIQAAANNTETPESRQDARLAAIAEATHYCPGCGRLSKYPRECTGTPAGSHAPIEAVSTDELGGDPANHTVAPNTDVLAA